VISEVQFSDERWLQFWGAFRGLPHQKAAVSKLAEHIRQVDPCLLTESAQWVVEFKSTPPEAQVRNPLPVKWQSQNDNASGTGYRECFSSSCAMLAMYWGKVANDNAYNAVRAKYGDSTDAQAQLAALRSLGLKADFHTDGNAVALEREIDAGRPVAVGWLHHGPVSAPTGGGHWSVVIGYTTARDAWIMHDPNGEARLAEGGYTPNTNGAGLRYSRRNWNPRWMVGGSGGWYLTCRP
jgi:hypothetical protein